VIAAQAVKTGEAEVKTTYEANLAKGRTEDQEVINKVHVRNHRRLRSCRSAP
jgi:hypothetical protein